jgi:dihydropteroate synthase
MDFKDTFFLKKSTITCKGKLVDLSTPKIMGILNVTPDSFYDGGRYTNKDIILRRVEKMLEEGADLIDIGAYSSRPGADDIPAGEELKRLEMALQPIREKFQGILVSVDTFRSEVAKHVVENFEVDIINDISAGNADKKMFDTIATLGIPYIIMHMKGTPKNMQENPGYKDVVKEIFMFFSEKLYQLRLLGVNDIIIDPGFGFGKTIEHNYQVLNQLDSFRMFELPVMVGISRKTMIYKTLDITPGDALNGTTVLHTISLLNGANILRVHDVKEAKQAIKLCELYMSPIRSKS